MDTKTKEQLENTLMLYIHIPFCLRKCRYCDFLSFSSCTEKAMDSYTQALVREIAYYGSRTNMPVSSVFLGGGTPSLLPAGDLETIMEAIKEHFDLQADAECTIEANPGTITFDKAQIMKRIGINRVSIGVQTFNDRLLKTLGRIHTEKQAEESLGLFQNAGFDNLSVDLMTGLPGQTVQDVTDSICKAVSLGVTHLSCYSLIVEEGTEFYRLFQKGQLPLPDEDTERTMYHEAVKTLRSLGFERYEISNFSKPGFQSRHNSGYWMRRPYLGLGLGASSLYDETRWHNTQNLAEYNKLAQADSVEISLKGIRRDVEKMTIKDQMEEFMFLGLRMDRGITYSDFRRLFKKDLYQVYGNAIEKHCQDGLLCKEEDRLHLTDRGVDLSNQVFVDFLID